MLTVSRRLDSETSVQQARELLDRAGRTLRTIQLALEGLTRDLDCAALDQALSLIERSLDESLDAHARIDAELLMATGGHWNHPVQAIGGPRAPFGRVASCCLERMAETQGEELERLQAIHQRVSQAHHLAETARRRRERQATARTEQRGAG